MSSWTGQQWENNRATPRWCRYWEMGTKIKVNLSDKSLSFGPVGDRLGVVLYLSKAIKSFGVLVFCRRLGDFCWSLHSSNSPLSLFRVVGREVVLLVQQLSGLDLQSSHPSRWSSVQQKFRQRNCYPIGKVEHILFSEVGQEAENTDRQWSAWEIDRYILHSVRLMAYPVPPGGRKGLHEVRGKRSKQGQSYSRSSFDQ
jgi:hypothetical protein